MKKLTIWDEDMIFMERMLDLVNRERPEYIFDIHDTCVKGKYNLIGVCNDAKRHPICLYKGLEIDEIIRLLAKYLSHETEGETHA